MKRSANYIALLAISISIVSLAGCSDGPSANMDQMAAARDAQMKAMTDQRNAMSRGNASVDAARKAGQAPTGTSGK